MSEEQLPELPPSQMNVEVWDSEVRGLHQANAPYFTAEQMREYARAAVRMERERAGRDALDVSVTELLLRQPQPTIADAIRDAVLAERERCARICEEGVSVPYPVPPATHKVVCLPELAAAIREGGR